MARKRYVNRCPICGVEIENGQRTCRSCYEVLKANPHLCVTDLM